MKLEANVPSNFTSSLLGFFAAVLLYFGILASAALYLSSQQEWIERYTSKKDSFMDIVLVARPKETPKSSPKTQESKVEPKTTMQKPQPKPKDSASKSPTVEAKPKANVRGLFKDIDTSKLEKPAEISTPKPKNQSRLKPNDSPSANTEPPKPKASSLVAGMELESVSQEQSATGVYDEYKGKITELLEGYWNETPDTVSGAEATVEVRIDSFGNFSYSIERLSYNNTFNAKLRDFLERMRSVVFPPSPEKQGMQIKTTFKDEMEL